MRLRTIVWPALVIAAACQKNAGHQAPGAAAPAAGQSSAGADAARDSILQGPHWSRQSAATAQISTARDDCRRVAITNQRFDVATTYFGHVIIQQTIRIAGCSNAESVPSTVTAEVWDLPADSAAPPRLTLVHAGDQGAARDNLYGITQPGCCGASSLTTWFSLVTGRQLFEATGDPVEIEAPNTPFRRYLAFHDGSSADKAPEETEDEGFLGVLQYGGDSVPAQRVALWGVVRGAYFRLDSLGVEIGDSAADTRDVQLWSANGSRDPASLTGFAAVIVLDAAETDTGYTGPETIRIVVPVIRDRLAPGAMTTDSRFQVRAIVRKAEP